MSADETKLPDVLAAGIEALTGPQMDGVRVHYESPEPAEVRAHTHTQDVQIHLAPGQDRHLAHEAWHVVGDSPGVRLQKADMGEVN